MTQIPWNPIVLAEFLRLTYLTSEEIKVLNMRIAKVSRVKIAFDCNMSESNVDKIIKRIRLKYDQAQKYSDILPKRKKSAKEKIKQSG